MAALGFVLLALGAALVYAGITGQSLLGELRDVLAGSSGKKKPAAAK